MPNALGYPHGDGIADSGGVPLSLEVYHIWWYERYRKAWLEGPGKYDPKFQIEYPSEWVPDETLPASHRLDAVVPSQDTGEA